MRFLIAGYGSIGRRQFRNLLALGEHDILFYRTGQGSLPEAELAGYRVETDLQAALDQRPDAVIVTNPTAYHLEVAIPAAEAGCHILLEKPVAHTLERVEAFSTAVERSGVRVLVGFQFRFHPVLQALKACLQSSTVSHGLPVPCGPAEISQAGCIGRPLSARAVYAEYLPGWHPWEDYRRGYSARADLGGGVVLTLCHPLDILRWLLGEVDSLWAFAGQLSDLETSVEDTAEIGLRLHSGVLASVHLDYNRQPPLHSLEITGTHGHLQWDASDGKASLYLAETGGWESLAPPEGFERNDLFLAEMRHFLKVVEGKEKPACTLKDGIQALRLALAALESSRSGQLVTL